MPDSETPLVFAILAVPESTASTIYGMYEILESPGRDWSLVTTGTPGQSRIRPIIASTQKGPFRAPNGLWIEPGCTLDECPAPDVVAIPDLLIAPDDDLSGRYPTEAQWLRERFAGGATLATACTGAWILAEAGLLDGQDATTHWAYCDAMGARYPSVRLHPGRSLVVSGEGRLVMAGGGTSWHDLALFLIARFVGAEEAMRVARLQLLDWHDAGQQPFAALTRGRQVSDAVIARCQDWIARHYNRDSPVAGMAQLSGLPERSFKRRFAQALGMPPIEYVHAVRLEEARRLLETSALPLDEIACRVGYEDATFLGRLFRRKVGLTPARYRKRFRALRQALDGGRATCLAAAIALSGALLHAQQRPAPGFSERVDVERVVVDARVLDKAGNPVTGLGAADFSVRVGRRPVAIESVMWVGGGAAPADAKVPADHGRLIVFLVQKDFERSRLAGLMRMLVEGRRFIDELTPRDRIAVLSFDTQLKIWLDFTPDREAVRQVLRRGILFESPRQSDGTPGIALASRLDPARASKTYTIERALLVIAEALRDVPGAKSIVLLGHGFGRLGWTGVTMEHEYEEARDALVEARTSVFSLDVTNADYHSLEAGLQLISRDTGGFFARTHLFVAQAMKRLSGAMAGYYVLFLERPDVDAGAHDIEVRLTRRQGAVFAKRTYVKPQSVR